MFSCLKTCHGKGQNQALASCPAILPNPTEGPLSAIFHPQPPTSLCHQPSSVPPLPGCVEFPEAPGLQWGWRPTQEGPSICSVPKETLLPTTRPPDVCFGAHLDSSPCSMNEQVTLNKLLYSSVPQSPLLQMIDNGIYWVCMRSKGTNMCMVFKAPPGMRLVPHKCSKTLLELMVTVAEAPCSRPQSLHLPLHHHLSTGPEASTAQLPAPDHEYTTSPLQTLLLTSV